MERASSSNSGERVKRAAEEDIGDPPKMRHLINL